VLTAEQSSNNDKGDVENTIQVLAELRKQQREAPFKAPQVGAPVQYTVLAEIPATDPADAHSTKKSGLHQLRPSPGSPSSVTSCSTAATTPRPLALPAEDLIANARATGEVLTAEQSSNNDKGDVENTIQVLAELRKQQREPPFKAPQMDAPVQYAIHGAADAHSTKKSGLRQPRPSPGSPSSVTSCSTTATTPRPLARHALDDLCGQDSVVGSDDFGY
jgi:hypothetical protein